MKVVTAAQMVALEQAAKRSGVSTDTLMENAGLAVARVAREFLNPVAGARALVLVGPGNNGADGLVTARHLRRWGAEVTAYVVTRRPDPDPKMDLALDYGISVVRANDDPGLEVLDRLLSRSRLLIDAVLGTGRARPLEGVVKEIMLRLGQNRGESSGFTVLALDLPTGVNSDTGEADPAGISADVTVALGYPKTGLLTFPGAARVGRLEVANIGLPSGLPGESDIALELLTSGWVGQRLPPRPLNSHKGTFGHALIVAGSRSYVGAAYLASQAAVRVGAGLVTLAAPRSVYAIAAGKVTEVIHFPLPEYADGRIHADAAPLIRDNLRRYTSMLVGCGLGWSSGTVGFLEQLLLAGPGAGVAPEDSQEFAPDLPPRIAPDILGGISTVIDADGLNNLSQLPDWWRRLKGPVALTPHPGEMATLTGSSTPEVQQDRLESARSWSSKWNVTLALKGAHTIIAEPGGLARISPFANPGLASGGTGDVLTGIIAGLMAQGLTPYDAACCGVYLHGRAAESVVARLGDTGTIASDLIPELPRTIRSLRQGR